MSFFVRLSGSAFYYAVHLLFGDRSSLNGTVRKICELPQAVLHKKISFFPLPARQWEEAVSKGRETRMFIRVTRMVVRVIIIPGTVIPGMDVPAASLAEGGSHGHKAKGN